jgi:hypothetical protein
VVTIAGGRRANPLERSMLKLLLVALIIACGGVMSPVGAEPVAKVSVLASGVVLLDGTPTTLPALEERLKTVKAANGVVWYHRENPAAEPPPQGTAVVQLIIKYRLPVSMSTKPDFSDVVDANGVSRPRAGR